MINTIIRRVANKRRDRIFASNAKKYEKRNDEWLSKNIIFNNSTKNEECFIIGNGPSIKDFDFKLLKGKDVFTLNQIARNENYKRINIKYHFWADPMFFYEDENHNKIISDDMYEQMLKIVQSNPNVSFFVTANLKNGVVKSLIDAGANVYRYPAYAETNKYFVNKDPKLNKPSPSFYNVMQYAIYAAICMGYKKIYLLGSEQTNLLTILNTKLNKNTDVTNYGYNINEAENERMRKHYNNFPVSRYLREHAKMFDDFNWLTNLAKNKNIFIYNCTEFSLIDSIPSVSLKQVLFSDINEN